MKLRDAIADVGWMLWLVAWLAGAAFLLALFASIFT